MPSIDAATREIKDAPEATTLTPATSLGNTVPEIAMTTTKVPATTSLALIALLLLQMPAEAGSLFGAARGSLAKRAAHASPAQGQQAAQAAHAAGKPRDVVIQRGKHPEAAQHIEHAQRNGQPTVLHIDRSGAAQRRSASTGSVNPQRKPGPNAERDEYPPAFTREGGHNANVRFIDRHDNRGAGGTMGAQTRDLPDGSKIRIVVRD